MGPSSCLQAPGKRSKPGLFGEKVFGTFADGNRFHGFEMVFSDWDASI